MRSRQVYSVGSEGNTALNTPHPLHSYYYVRLRQANGQLAWSGPISVEAPGGSSPTRGAEVRTL